MINKSEANKTIHKVQMQWHYDKLTKHGWIADTPESIGFVRSYNYHHPKSDIKITVTTGCNGDYWSAKNDKKEIDGGWWSTLEPFVVKINS